MKYPIVEIADILGVDYHSISNKNATVSQLLTDSRSLTDPEETIFFALKTANNDGHNYIASLYQRGVRSFVVNHIDNVTREMREANFLVVPDTLEALQTLATNHRRRFHIPVIGITGSRGKTTVKEWLNHLLADDYKIVRSPRSYNSQIGVPLSLWDIDDHTSLAIIEAGISTTGEMDNLQAMIRPTIGVITNIGSEHNEGFASMDEKAREKAKILNSCESIVYCADDPLVTATIAPLLEVDVAHAYAWSTIDKKQALLVEKVEKEGKESLITYCHGGAHHTFKVPFTAARDVENVITCLVVMTILDIAPDVIASRMATLTPVGTRINVIEGVNNCTLIADGYTSDYNSLTPALDFMMRRSNPDRHNTVILSDLIPDVFSPDELYIRVSELLKSKHIKHLIGIGREMCAYSRYFNSIHAEFYESVAQFLDKKSAGDFENETILVKGAPDFEFSQIIHLLSAKQHQTVEEVNLNALAHNFKFFRSFLRPDTKAVAMVKAGGYGTGSYEIAKTLQDAGCDYLAVAVQDEGVDLRKAGIVMPIIVLNPSVVNYKSIFKHHLEPEVYSIEECRSLIKEGAKYSAHDFPVHIKIDTGMHRLGFTKEQLPALIELLKSQDVIKPASMFSHLCVADEPAQDAYTMRQFAYFEECTAMVQAAFNHYILRHILNTTGIVRFPEKQFDMVRIGIGLYGIKTVTDHTEDALKPVASLHSVIISIKEWDAGTTIGYGRHGVLTRPSRIATVTIGYADGFDRHFGNGNARMWVNGSLCPTVGNVCMDAVMIDVTEAQCQVGDVVEIFGEHIPVEALSDVRGTIPYEILTSVSPRVKRVYYRE